MLSHTGKNKGPTLEDFIITQRTNKEKEKKKLKYVVPPDVCNSSQKKKRKEISE